MRDTTRWRGLLLPLGLALVLGLLHADVLLSPTTILSGEQQDIQRSFGHWRGLAGRDWAAGRAPLWNPAAYGGVPLLGAFQAGALYPTIGLYAALPVGLAVDLELVFHVWLAALGAAFLAGCHGASWPGRVVAGLVYGLGGPLTGHLFGGHVGHVVALAWVPWWLGALDRLVAEPGRLRLAAAGASGALLLLAGNPQLAYYAMGFGGAQVAWDLGARRRQGRDWRAPAALALAAPLLAGGLAAAQWLPGLAASSTSARDRPLPPALAVRHALPPEAALTVVAPDALGDHVRQMYWGRSALWEVCLFCGAGALLLAGLAAGVARPLVLGLLALLVALGDHGPLFDALYAWLPGFDRLRAHARVAALAQLQLAVVAGLGACALSRGAVADGRRRVVVVAGVGLALGLAGLAAWAHHRPGAGGPVAELFGAVSADGRGAVAPFLYRSPEMVLAASAHLARALVWPAVAALLAAVAVGLSRRWPRRATAGLAALVLVELLALAVGLRQTSVFVPGEVDEEVAAFVGPRLADGRVADLRAVGNRGVSSGVPHVWGLGPEVSRRWFELFAVSQGADPEATTEEGLTLRRWHPILRMMRLKYVYAAPPARGGSRLGLERVHETARGCWIYETPDPLPRALLVDRARVVDRAGALAAVVRPDFDPRREVLLEAAPDPLPQVGDGPPGEVRRLFETPGRVRHLEVTLTRPAVLVLTDAYRAGWRVEGAARALRVQPANVALMAVPLPAGTHRFALVYRPPGWTSGTVLSALALLVLGLLVLPRRRAGAVDCPPMSTQVSR